MTNIKQETESNEILPSVDADLSIFPNNSEYFNAKHPIPQLNNNSKVNTSNEQQINTDNWFIPFDSNLKRECSQTFLPRTRSFSFDLSNLYSLNNGDNTNNVSQTPFFNTTFTHNDLNFTEALYSNKRSNNGNVDESQLANVMSGETSTSLGDEDSSNSDSIIFSPRTFLSRPSSISPDSLNEIVDSVIKSKKVGKERKLHVKKVKASHNDIERKYRLGINDKIVQLRNLVPTIRYGFKEISNIPLEQSDIDALDGLEPTKKLNKGTILNKTIEYIKHLEAKCEQYKNLNSELTNRLASNQFVVVPPSSIASSKSSKSVSSTVVTPSIKNKSQPQNATMQQDFNTNVEDDRLVGNKQYESISPLTKVFIENNSGNDGNNLFEFGNFS